MKVFSPRPAATLGSAPVPRKTPLLAASLLVVALAGCSGEKTDAEYLQQAQQAAAEGKHQELIINLKNALQQNPENREARFLLGQYYLTQYEGAAAEKELNKAIEFGRPQHLTTLPLTRALFMQGDYPRLLSQSADISQLPEADKAEVRFYRGLVYLNQRQPQDAMLEFKTAETEQPETAFGQLSKAYAALLEQQLELASTTIDAVLQQHPDEVQAYMLKGRIAAAQKDYSGAVSAIEQAVTLQPRNLRLYVDHARVQLAAEDYEGAEKNIDFVLNSAPRYLPALLIKASLRMRAQDWEAARQHAEQAIANSRSNQQAKLIAGMANFYLENWEIARKHLTAIKRDLPGNHIAHRMLTFTELKMGYDRSAEDVINNIGDLAASDSALLMSFGAELAKDGEYQDAQSIFSTVADMTEAPDALTKLGILKLHQQDESGIADLQKALQKQPEFSWARAALADAYIKQGEGEKAGQVMEDFIALQPDKVEPYLLAANTYLQLGRIDMAEQHLAKAQQLDADNVDIYQTKARLALAQDAPEQAIEQLQKVITLKPDHAQAIAQLYRLHRLAGDDAKAMSVIDQALGQSPDNPSLTFLQAMAEVDQGLVDKGLATLNSIPTDNTQLYSRAQRIAGALELKRNKPEQALKHFQNWQQQSPDDISAYFALSQAHARSQQWGKALQSLRSGLEKKPDHKLLKITEVRLLLDSGQADQALDAAEKFERQQGTNATLEMMLGSYFAKQESYQKAIQHFSASHQLNPSSRSTIGLAELYYRTDDLDKANSLLDDWLSAHPEDQAASLYRANLAMNQAGQNNMEAAIEQYRRIVNDTPENFIAHNNLAWSLAQSGQLTEALQHSKAAHELQPEHTDVMDTYGYILLLSGQHSEALGLLQKAYNANKNEPAIAYHYAMALSQNNDIQGAKALLKGIVQTEFKEQEEAAALLESLR